MTDQEFRYLQLFGSPGPSPSPSPSATPGGTPVPPWAEPTAIPGTGQPWYFPYPGPPSGDVSTRGALWPGAAYPSYGRFQEGIRDFTSGPRAAQDLIPGYHGQNVISTDRPLPGELPYPWMGPGTYLPAYAGVQESLYPGADVEPTPIPTGQGGFLPAFQGMDVPSETFGPTLENPSTPMEWGELPPSPDFTPSDYFMSPYDSSDTASVMSPSNTGTPVYDPNSYTPYTDFPGSQPNYYPGPSNETAPSSSVAQSWGEPDFGGFTNTDSSTTSASPDEFSVEPDPLPGTPDYLFQQQQEDTGGSAPAATSNIPYGGDPGVERNTAPWYPGRPDMTWAANRDVYATPTKPGLFQQLSQPTNWSNVGKIFVDATGNIVDATGKVLASAGDFAQRTGKSVADFFGQEGFSSADYLASMGYHEMDTGEMVPFSITGPTVGAFDVGAYGAGQGGGSYFHGGASAGMQHGATSVAGATAGAFGPGSNLGMTSWGNAINQEYLRRMRRGLYTTPETYAATQHSLAPVSGFTGAPPATFQQFHASQVQLGDILRANPNFGLSRPAHGEFISPRTQGVPRGTPPVLPT